ncbi:MAG: hypothetical protein M5U33_13245 [Pseudorhodoplanes sp.]|nr:hypothetical protein [Pseudorhodoplanes sp.]
MCGHANAAVGPVRACDGVHRIADEIEDHLLQLDAVSVDRGQRVGNVKLHRNLIPRSVGTHKRQGLVEHLADFDRGFVRAAAPQEVAHVAHDPADMVDLGDGGGQVAVGARLVAAGAQDVLRRARQRARRRHRLVDLVRQRGGHAADEVEARGLRGLGFGDLQTRLGLAREPVGGAPLADHDADDQAGGGEDQHQHLQLGEGARVIVVDVQERHHAELGHRQREAGAVEAVADGRDHGRNEEQIEEAKPRRAVADRHDPKSGDEHDDIKRCLGQHRAKRGQ